MIVPLIGDRDWVETFVSLPELSLPDAHLLVVAPHPDDETLGAGALIWSMRRKGLPVTVVAVTDGENAYDAPQQERVRMGNIREKEQRDALKLLGVTPEFVPRLRLTDSGLHDCVEELTRCLMDLARPGMHLLAPWGGDFHPDHIACAKAAKSVAEAKHLPLTSYFFWTWHRGTMDVLAGLPLRQFPVSTEAQEAKSRALACHRSQLEHTGGEPVLPDNLLGPAQWPMEVFLPS